LASGFGEALLHFLFTSGADHHGAGVEEEFGVKGHAAEVVVFGLAEGDVAGGAVLDPVVEVLIALKFFGAGFDVGVLLKKVVHSLTRFFGEGEHHAVSAGEAHGVFEDAFGAL